MSSNNNNIKSSKIVEKLSNVYNFETTKAKVFYSNYYLIIIDYLLY